MADSPIHNLSICSGVAMLDEGFALATGTRTVGYVEREASAAAILLARMADAALEPAPVWCGDLYAFDGKRWRGAVDSITAGFPCQPWSAAGKKSGIDDERWIWPGIARIIGEVEPAIVFLENVPGLVTHDGLGHVLSSLAELGFDAEWGSIRASDVGASHQRERIFILAYACSRKRSYRSKHGERRAGTAWSACEILAYRAEFGRARTLLSAGSGRQERDAEADAGGSKPAMANTDATRSGRLCGGEIETDAVSRITISDVADGGTGLLPQSEWRADRRNGVGSTGAEFLADAHGRQCEESGRSIEDAGNGERRLSRFDGGSEELADTEPSGISYTGYRTDEAETDGMQGTNRQRERFRFDAGQFGSGGVFAPGPGSPEWRDILRDAPWLAPAVEPGVRMLADGLAVVVDESRADQLRAIGNGVVALQAAVAFRILARRIIDSRRADIPAK